MAIPLIKKLHSSEQGNGGETKFTQPIHPRIQTRFEIPYWKYVRVNQKGKNLIGFVKNMSVGGVFIETDIYYEPGTEIGFEFFLPNSTAPVKGTAVVKWSCKMDDEILNHEDISGMGVQFISFEGESEGILKNFIEEELKKM